MYPLVALDPVTIMTTAVGDLSTTFGGVAPVAITLAVAVFGLQFGWHLVKKFVH